MLRSLSLCWRRSGRYWLGSALILALYAGTALAASAGSVVGINGACFVERAGARTPLKISQALEVGDTVDVPVEGKLKLRMADGSIVSVASGTRMTIAAFTVNAAGQRRDARLSLTQGLLRAVVAPVEQPARFEVDTGVGTAAVRSTDWFVEKMPAAMRVGVLTGSVVLTSNETKHSVTIPARWGAKLEAEAVPVQQQQQYAPHSLQRPPGAAPAGPSRALSVPRMIVRDPGPPRVWAKEEFDAVIARTDVK